jgi:Ca2+-dependent lipid-binding protein
MNGGDRERLAAFQAKLDALFAFEKEWRNNDLEWKKTMWADHCALKERVIDLEKSRNKIYGAILVVSVFMGTLLSWIFSHIKFALLSFLSHS